ncbi:DUF484 family protein [Pseudoalteromonas xiamenensis]|uniref:DUF484 family protein n=1 Tax=Pseudoalteromonas xiamenensis TaxID=882626 RepID=UPI00244DF1F8|nr:DUF484 family protein [Pseudoalteromonas xiamenensis]
MSEQPLDKKVVTELQEHQVAAYLSRHPDFFRHHPYLLLESRITQRCDRTAQFSTAAATIAPRANNGTQDANRSTYPLCQRQ